MKNLKSLLSLVVVVLSFQFASAQNLAMVEVPNKMFVGYSASDTDIRIDKTGIAELSEYIKNHVYFPVEELGYINEARIKLQVSINANGKIIDARQIEGPSRIGKAVLNTLKSLDRVSPILVNGVPKTKTIYLPLIFRQ